MSKKYVIIGAGLTGTLLALEIRKLDKKAQIYVYDKEETDFMDPSIIIIEIILNIYIKKLKKVII
ncbi:hypothetical protein [Mycoplasma mycoides]|uniref:hypothetical protein n=1 Tax=Mycoplasma mycoides TaxID=2102 RepID=UPI00223F50FE|nr:hypothetical protein [Mycoplasma mycoides]